MRYLLVVGFACEVYRREPRARIFVGDKLIDEFTVSHSTDNLFTLRKKNIEKYHILNPLLPTNLYNLNTTLKFYELRIDKKNENIKIRIIVDNNDSNFSNGFITASTLVKFKNCAFFPLDKKMILKLKGIRDKKRSSKNYAWYRTNKSTLFDLLQNGMIWKGDNSKNLQSRLKYYTVGGNGEFVCQLTKKYGILSPQLACPWRYSFDCETINYFIDKYHEHANHRNFN